MSALEAFASAYIVVMLIYAMIAWHEHWPPTDWFKIPVFPLFWRRARF